MRMSCIMMHSNYDAFMCIKSYSTARFGCIARAIWMQLPGADELEEEEEEEEEENDDDTILEELDECIVAGGKTSEEIKQMTALEKNEHAQLCDKNRGIKAKDLSRIATKMGCPEMKTTKYDRLQWIFVAYLKA